MYIAMNRFTVPTENEADFEDLWLNRDSHLKSMEGFVEFQMLKGPVNKDDGTRLYASHTVWADEAAFTAWTTSEAFRAAHRDAGSTRKLYNGHPNFEGFNSIQEISSD